MKVSELFAVLQNAAPDEEVTLCARCASPLPAEDALYCPACERVNEWPPDATDVAKCDTDRIRYRTALRKIAGGVVDPALVAEEALSHAS